MLKLSFTKTNTFLLREIDNIFLSTFSETNHEKNEHEKNCSPAKSPLNTSICW